MTSGKKTAISKIEKQVYKFLEKNPDFLAEHPELLEQLHLTHNSGEAASLIEHQVIRLREKNSELSRQMRQLVHIAGENEKLMSRLHQLSLRLAAIDNLTDFFTTLSGVLAEEFNAEQLYVGLLCELQDAADSDLINQLSADDPELKRFAVFLDRGKTACGRLNRDKLEFLFGEAAGIIKSTALVPLGEQAEYGFIAIGSADPNRFFPGMGTLFLELLGDVVSHRLAESKLEPRRRFA
jgi:uncharacterized protein YigA (DUF484 family)